MASLSDWTSGQSNTVVCRIVRRLLISVHKCQFTGMADTHEYWSQHRAHLLYSLIFHFFIIFSKCKNQNSHKFVQIGYFYSFQQRFNIFVNFDFRIMKKLWDFSPWKIGKYNALCWDQYSWASAIPIYVLKSANGRLFYTPRN